MILRLRAGVSTTDTETAMVLLDEHAGKYWQLNGTGAQVLRDLLDGRSPGEVADHLAEEHPAAAPRARDDVDRLIAALQAANLVAG